MTQLASYYKLAESLATDLRTKIAAGQASASDISATDLALEMLEKEANEASIAATSQQERSDAERFWQRVRHYREVMGLPFVESMSLLVEDAVKH